MRLLVVEDEEGIRNMLVRGLEEDGHQVVSAGDVSEAQQRAAEGSFEAYLLDVLLPGPSGTDLCRWLRERGVKEPILLVTALSASAEKVAGFDAGADDYLTKPFDLAEIKARLRALERKAQGYPRAELSVHDLVLDPNTQTASRAGVALELSKKEYALLEFLVRNKGVLVTRPMIAKGVWDSQTGLYTNVIDVYLAYIRKKVDGDNPVRLLHTLRGKGVMVSDTPPEKP